MWLAASAHAQTSQQWDRWRLHVIYKWQAVLQAQQVFQLAAYSGVPKLHQPGTLARELTFRAPAIRCCTLAA